MADDIDFAEWSAMRSMMGPVLADSLMREALKTCWGCVSPERRRVHEVEAEFRALAARTADEFRKDSRRFLDLAWEDAMHSIGPEGVLAYGRPTELAETVFDAVFDAKACRSFLRESLKTCWLTLPNDQRDPEKVVAVFERLVERAIRDMKEDARLFSFES